MKMRNVSSLVMRFFELPMRAAFGVSPRDLTLSTGAFGRLTLAAASTDRLHFSLSRTRHAIALALAGGLDVGIDIECLGRGPDVARQAEIFCDARELGLWRRCLWRGESTG